MFKMQSKINCSMLPTQVETLAFDTKSSFSERILCRKIRFFIETETILRVLIIKPNMSRYTNFSNIFWNETLNISDNSFVLHQEFFTVHTAMIYVIQIC